MCGIVGIVSSQPVSQEIYDALLVLQHRGQDSAGIVTTADGRCFMRKDNGLVSEVFQQHHISNLLGNVGIGHVRYPTAGSASSLESQPMYVNSPYGICLAHNGNLTNTKELRDGYFRDVMRHINTTSDSELLLNVLAHEIGPTDNGSVAPEQVFDAVRRVNAVCRGAYAAVALIVGGGILGFRDPRGIRPLIVGSRGTGTKEYMVASESVALDILGYEIMRDVRPGEAVFIDLNGHLHSAICAPNPRLTPCIFEHVYLARPDSIIDNVSVYKARLRMGEKLADRILTRFENGKHDIDVVIPIPETSSTAAISVAHRLNVKLREGFVKNRYIGRTFIMPGQSMRRRSVRYKLNAIKLLFENKNVLLIEDSVVRGTTLDQIVRQARGAGANKVYVAVAAPPVRYPNVFGIDMPTSSEFIATDRTEDQIAQIIGADLVIYQDLKDLIESARQGNPEIDGFECSIFDGNYHNHDVDNQYLLELSGIRADSSKQRDLESLGYSDKLELRDDISEINRIY